MKTNTHTIARSILILSFIFLSIDTASGQFIVAFPDNVNSPGLSEKFESKLNIALKPQVLVSWDFLSPSTARVYWSPSINAAFAAAKHIGLIESFYFQNGTHTGTCFESGIGYFTSIRTRGRFEAYTGFGMGRLDAPSDYGFRYHRFFEQVAVGYCSKHFAFNGGCKFTVQKADEIKYAAGYRMAEDYTVYLRDKTYQFIQPYFGLEAGGIIRFSFQCGFTHCLNSDPMAIYNSGGSNPGVYMSMGLILHLNPNRHEYN